MPNVDHAKIMRELLRAMTAFPDLFDQQTGKWIHLTARQLGWPFDYVDELNIAEAWLISCSDLDRDKFLIWASEAWYVIVNTVLQISGNGFCVVLTVLPLHSTKRGLWEFAISRGLISGVTRGVGRPSSWR